MADPAVLANAAGYDDVRAKVAASAVVCALTTAFKIASTLSSADTLDFEALEEAFLSAGAAE